MHAINYSLENDVINPSIEIGAFEALWANGISSFKQFREKLKNSNSELPSHLVDKALATQFYERTIQKLQNNGILHFGVRIDGTMDYPQKLYDADYPLVLFYYQGNWDLAFTRGVSVVGTRHPSYEGIQRTRRLVKSLVEAGFTIYAGLAAGIDTVAHSTAIEMKGKTIAVIGTPLWLRYPKENAKLQEEISRHHLLISQVPIVSYESKSIPFTRLFFPERNKTMAALSEATIIVEAGQTSGTLIQAKAALKQGRKVFILNNNFENPALSWPQKLEADGAIRVYDVDDILQGLASGNN
ncbi:MAG: DNA-processing protein DprA [Legionellales bacterium]|nr:DNA-processing protein DprA [Legionellales bacterium]